MGCRGASRSAPTRPLPWHAAAGVIPPARIDRGVFSTRVVGASRSAPTRPLPWHEAAGVIPPARIDRGVLSARVVGALREAPLHGLSSGTRPRICRTDAPLGGSADRRGRPPGLPRLGRGGTAPCPPLRASRRDDPHRGLGGRCAAEHRPLHRPARVGHPPLPGAMALDPPALADSASRRAGHLLRQAGQEDRLRHPRLLWEWSSPVVLGTSRGTILTCKVSMKAGEVHHPVSVKYTDRLRLSNKAAARKGSDHISLSAATGCRCSAGLFANFFANYDLNTRFQQR